MDLKGKNVIYVGGFGGIGYASCKFFLAKHIANLAIFDLAENPVKLQELKNAFPAINIFFVQMDITNKTNIEDAYKEAIEKMGHFDVLVNGSGLISDRQVDLTIQVNLLGLIHSTLTAIPYMDKSNGGRGGIILNISSVVGVQPTAVIAIYSAAKHGVTAFTRSISHEYYFKRSNISFITLCPGFTETPLIDSLHGKDTFECTAPMTSKISLVKKQKPEQCAAHLVEVVETAKNGSVWIADLGELKELEMPTFWKPTY